MSHKGHKGTQGWQGSQDPNDVPDDVYGFGSINNDNVDEQGLERVKQMVKDSMDSAFFHEHLEKYYAKLEDEITDCMMNAQSDMPDGQNINLHSAAGCRIVAKKIVNNVLKAPYEPDDDSLVSGQGVWNGGEECPF